MRSAELYLGGSQKNKTIHLKPAGVRCWGNPKVFFRVKEEIGSGGLEADGFEEGGFGV